eukprot:SAG25_NODE_2051_length_1999_cov_1.381579_3_plen_225_part_00
MDGCSRQAEYSGYDAHAKHVLKIYYQCTRIVDTGPVQRICLPHDDTFATIGKASPVQLLTHTALLALAAPPVSHAFFPPESFRRHPLPARHSPLDSELMERRVMLRQQNKGTCTQMHAHIHYAHPVYPGVRRHGHAGHAGDCNANIPIRAHLEVRAVSSVEALAVRVCACKLHNCPTFTHSRGMHRGLQLLLSAVARAVEIEYPLYIATQTVQHCRALQPRKIW